MTFPWLSSITFCYLYVTTLVPNSCRHFDKTKPHISHIIFKSGVDGSGWLNPLYHRNLSLSGSSSRCYLTSWRMFLHLESKTRNKQSLGHKSWIWSTLNPEFCTRLYLMLRNLVSIPRSSLDHMSMASWVVQVPNLRIWLWNKWANCILINLLWDKPHLCLNPPKRWVYFPCNHRTRRETSSPEGIRKRVKKIIRVGTRMKMPILMTRTTVMLGGGQAV